MRLKQLESLRAQHRKNLESKINEKPSVSKAIALALISGQQLKLKPTSEIVAAARGVIADCACRYGSSERTLKFSQIFSFSSEELNDFKAKEKKREAMVRAYSKKADRIMRRAELDDTMDATEASEELAQAAYDAGLID